MIRLEKLKDDKKKVLEEILATIRDKCPQALEAVTYVETKTGRKATQSLNYFRDSLLHLATTLKHINKAGNQAEFMQKQLGKINELIRKAIIEPYEYAIMIQAEELKENWNTYQGVVLPVKKKINPSAISPDEIKVKMETIQELIQKGREAKSEADWSSTWEKGCKSFIDAYHEADTLNNQLREEIAKANDYLIRKRKYTTTITISVIVAVIFYFLGVLNR